MTGHSSTGQMEFHGWSRYLAGQMEVAYSFFLNCLKCLAPNTLSSELSLARLLRFLGDALNNLLTLDVAVFHGALEGVLLSMHSTPMWNTNPSFSVGESSLSTPTRLSSSSSSLSPSFVGGAGGYLGDDHPHSFPLSQEIKTC